VPSPSFPAAATRYRIAPVTPESSPTTGGAASDRAALGPDWLQGGGGTTALLPRAGKPGACWWLEAGGAGIAVECGFSSGLQDRGTDPETLVGEPPSFRQSGAGLRARGDMRISTLYIGNRTTRRGRCALLI